MPHLFTGRRYDFEVKLYYYRARYYSATLGRFLQTDPIGYDDQMNLYAYVGNDPVNLTDPTGMRCVGAGDDSRCTIDKVEIDGELRPLTNELRQEISENNKGLAKTIEKAESAMTDAYKAVQEAGEVKLKGNRDVPSNKVSGKAVAQALRRVEIRYNPGNPEIGQGQIASDLDRGTVTFGDWSTSWNPLNNFFTSSSDLRTAFIHEGIHFTRAAKRWNAYFFSNPIRAPLHQRPFDRAARKLYKSGRRRR